MSSFAIGLATTTATRAGMHVKGYLDQPEPDIISAGRLSWLQFFGFSSAAGAAATVQDTLAGSKEIPIIQKGFMGVGEAALEAAVAGCPDYMYGGIAVIAVLVILAIIAFFLIKYVQTKVDFNETGPQPLGLLWIIGGGKKDPPAASEFDHELELLPGQRINVIPPAPPPSSSFISYGNPVVFSLNGNAIPPVPAPQEGQEASFFERFQRPGMPGAPGQVPMQPPGAQGPAFGQRVFGQRFGGDDPDNYKEKGVEMAKNLATNTLQKKLAATFDIQIEKAKQIHDAADKEFQKKIVNVEEKIANNIKLQLLLGKVNILEEAKEKALEKIGELIDDNVSVKCLSDVVNGDIKQKLLDKYEKAIEDDNGEEATVILEQLEELKSGGSVLFKVCTIIFTGAGLFTAIKKFLVSKILFAVTIGTAAAKEKLKGSIEEGGAKIEESINGVAKKVTKDVTSKAAKEFDKFESFGGWKPQGADGAKVLGRFSGLISDSNKSSIYFSAWLLVVLILQAVFLKVFTDPSFNAKANFGLKLADTIVRFYVAPQTNKDAAFNDIWAQVSNVLQVATITKFITDKSGGVFGGRRQGVDASQVFGGSWWTGDMMARYFFGSAIVGLAPALFAAMEESLKAVFRFYRKSKMAKAKAKDVKRKADAFQADPLGATLSAVKDRPEFKEAQEKLDKALGDAIGQDTKDKLIELTTHEDFPTFYTDFKDTLAGNKKNKEIPNPLLQTAFTLKNKEEYAKLRECKVFVEFDANNPQTMQILDLVEHGQGIDVKQLAKDISTIPFYYDRACLVLYRLPLKAFTDLSILIEQRARQLLDAPGKDKANKRAVPEGEIGVKINGGESDERIVCVKIGSRIEVLEAPRPKGPQFTFGAPNVFNVNGNPINPMPAPWLQEKPEEDPEMMKWQAMMANENGTPLEQNPNARSILFDKQGPPRKVQDDKSPQDASLGRHPQMQDAHPQMQMRNMAQQQMPNMAQQQMQQLRPNGMTPQPAVISTAPPFMGSSRPSMVPGAGMPMAYPGAPRQ